MNKIGLVAIAASSLALHSAAPAAAEVPQEWRAKFGVLADMAGKDFLYYNGSSAFGGARVEWIQPGEALRFVDFQGKDTTDCKLAGPPDQASASGTCVINGKRELGVRVERTDTGGVKLRLVQKDMLLGAHGVGWLNLQPGDAPGEYSMPVPLDRYKVRPFPADLSGSNYHFVRWIPEALAKAGHVPPVRQVATVSPPPAGAANEEPPREETVELPPM